MDTELLKISIEYKVPFAEVTRLADLIEHEGKIVYPELNDLPASIFDLIKAVHNAVRISQTRRGVIKEGEESIVITRKHFSNGR